jgi:hypothetical protein
MRCCFLVLLLALPSSAFAAGAESGPSASPWPRPVQACGATVADALKQAQLSLDAGTAQSQRAALEFVIEAVGRLDAISPVKQREGHQNLSVPDNHTVMTVK